MRRCRAAPSSDVKVLVVGNPANTNALIAQANAKDLDPRSLHGDDPPRPQPGGQPAGPATRRARDRRQEAGDLGQPLDDAVPRTSSTPRSAGATPTRRSATTSGSSRRSSRPSPSAARRSSRPAAHPRRRRRRAPPSTTSAHGCSGTPAGDWMSMAVVSDGSYDVPEGVIFSFPVTCAGGDVLDRPGPRDRRVQPGSGSMRRPPSSSRSATPCESSGSFEEAARDVVGHGVRRAIAELDQVAAFSDLTQWTATGSRPSTTESHVASARRSRRSARQRARRLGGEDRPVAHLVSANCLRPSNRATQRRRCRGRELKEGVEYVADERRHLLFADVAPCCSGLIITSPHKGEEDEFQLPFPV